MPHTPRIAVTNYTVQGFGGSFQFSLNIDTGVYTLTALGLDLSGTHFDLTNADGALSGGRLAIGGLPGGISIVLRNAGPDFLLDADATTLRGKLNGTDVTLSATLAVDPVNSVEAVYEVYGGRAPSAQEQSYWEDGIAAGRASLASVRTAILTDTHGIGDYARGQIGNFYSTFMGRGPTADEVTFWEGRLAGGDYFGSIRSAVLLSYDGRILERDTVRALYTEYGGRAATSAEDNYWYVRIRDGADYDTVRTTILDDPLGQQHTASTLNARYMQYFDRAPTENEAGVWQALLHNGATFGTLIDALLSDSASATTGVRHLAGTAGRADTFDFGTRVGNATIDGFEPGRDRIDLHRAGYAGINPLDATHAQQVTAVDGSKDVLITLDAQNHLLLHDVSLTSLSWSDFLI